LILLFVLVYAGIAYEFMFFFNDKTTVNSDALAPLIFAGVILIFVTMLIFSSTLETRIDEVGITYRFSPIHSKTRNIPWDGLEECGVRKYSPILEYGGWGFRGGIKSKLFGIGKNGVAFNVRGKIGIQMKLKDGSKILIGTQKMAQAEEVIKKYSYKMTNNKRN
jgi:hypothetical protein